MHTTPEEILARIRQYAAEARSPAIKAAYRPPAPGDFAPDVQVLCFDQSLSNVGWSLLNSDGGKLSVIDSGTIVPPPLGKEVKGFAVTTTKAIFIAREIGNMLNDLYGRWEQVVVEMPSVFGYRTESSLVALVTICTELDRMGEEQPVMVSRQAAAARLCGDRHASKAATSALVNDLVQKHPTGKGQWTEHVRDSVLVGLHHTYVGDA